MALARLEYLFECYVSHQCSEEETKELMALITQSENELIVKNLIEKVVRGTSSEIKIPNQSADTILKNILEKDKAKVITYKPGNSIIKSWMRVAAAAVLILFISGIVYRVFTKENKKEMTTSVPSSKKAVVILPGGNHATLTLADGSTIVLDSLHNGNLQHGNANIKKQNGVLVYDGSKLSEIDEPVTYNTLTTPRGGQYQVVLADGSKVWLNASSSLRFPTVFVGKQREVELTGEAYFEIAKNKDNPFQVKVNGMQVKVLGTHFNINAYPEDGEIKTSLLEGSVKISKGAASGLLKPGQQGVVKNDDNNIEINNADMDEVMAWKNGLFQFDGANITTIMHEIGRWYNVDVVYAGKISNRRFEGKISRSAPLQDVLRILELSNVNFEVEGNKIIVQ